MLFRRASVRYGRTPEPETPFQKAAQVWDERIGSARVQARNWRLLAFGNLFLAAGLAGGLIWQAPRGTVTPWVVEVDKLGQAQAVSAAVPTTGRPIRRSPGISRVSSRTSAPSRQTPSSSARIGSPPMTSSPTRVPSPSTITREP